MGYREEYGAVTEQYKKNRGSKKRGTSISSTLGTQRDTQRGQAGRGGQQLLGAGASESLSGYGAELMARGPGAGGGRITGKVSRTSRDRGSGTFSMGGRFQTTKQTGYEKFEQPERKFRGEQVEYRGIKEGAPDWQKSGHSADTTTMRFKGLMTGREQSLDPGQYQNTMKDRAFKASTLPQSPYGRRAREVNRRKKNTGERVR